jgi:hypothetical protein
MNLSCIFLAPNSRQRRKRVDVRVAELEKELKDMRRRLDDRETSSSAPPSEELGVPTGTENNKSVDPFSSPNWLTPNAGAPVPSETVSASSEQEMSGIEELTDSTAMLLFEEFATNLAPHFPCICFPPQVSAHNTSQKQPVLFLAIITAAAIGLYPSTAHILAARLEQMYANRVFIGGEKSLELIQSLLITAVWYHPPDKFENLKFTQYAHMAANMALDLHIGKGRSSQAALDNGHESSQPGISPDSNSIESRRTYISCYLLCSRLVWLVRNLDGHKLIQILLAWRWLFVDLICLITRIGPLNVSTNFKNLVQLLIINLRRGQGYRISRKSL